MVEQSVTTETKTATPKTTVAWCVDCRMSSTHVEEIGSHCWNIHCLRTLVKRVGYVCKGPGPRRDWPCDLFHRTVKSMKECAHNAY